MKYESMNDASKCKGQQNSSLRGFPIHCIISIYMCSDAEKYEIGMFQVHDAAWIIMSALSERIIELIHMACQCSLANQIRIPVLNHGQWIDHRQFRTATPPLCLETILASHFAFKQ